MPTMTPALRDYYQKLWGSMVIHPDRVNQAATEAVRIGHGESRYRTVQLATGVPWWFTGVIHSLEGGLNFNTHLHNGDSLNDRTHHVPRGRPLPPARPPFQWEFSADDALRLEGLDHWHDWSLTGALFRLELFNGWGTHLHGINSPYLWSFSSNYSKGKFVHDGPSGWDPSFVSDQVGAAVLLRCMLDQKLMQFPI